MTGKRILFEAPVYTHEAAILAAANGVDRLELCADFGEGGTTPSAGLLKVIKRQVPVPVFVMIRPRGGDFMYSPGELEAMLADIKILGDVGADGFVFGALHSTGKVDVDACKRLLEAAQDKPCTFHRAFDKVPDQFTALESIVSLGFKRILTSGGKNRVSEGLSVLTELLTRAANRVTVLPGGGLTAEDLVHLNQSGFLREVHSSCKYFRPSEGSQQKSEVRLSLLDQTEGKVLTVDPALVQSFRNTLDDLR
ncbi:copper homeostasis protein CutC [Cyclobacterium jeungdonense]|uniref:PF03932 family protein CutC n=1 Tax=Cyclobacterium jeungdonense TaxID=708087 RepID=A0ABT8CBV1_9BACT|nr:copper homeostasis protein CutC [Cyclobacterium jeungdonense]MDN3689235.1 copper homeostasis protein CutC [Cyclobacterium jeungdonense]